MHNRAPTSAQSQDPLLPACLTLAALATATHHIRATQHKLHGATLHERRKSQVELSNVTAAVVCFPLF